MRETLLKWKGKQVVIQGNPQEEFLHNRNLWKDCKVVWAEDTFGKAFHQSMNKLILEQPVDHLWIEVDCLSANILAQEGDRCLAVGQIEYYQRDDGSQDLNITPISHDQKVDLLLGFFCYLDIGILAFSNPKTSNYCDVWRRRHEVLRRIDYFLGQYRVRTKVADTYRAIAEFTRLKINQVSKKSNCGKKPSKKGFGYLVA